MTPEDAAAAYSRYCAQWQVRDLAASEDSMERLARLALFIHEVCGTGGPEQLSVADLVVRAGLDYEAMARFLRDSDVFGRFSQAMLAESLSVGPRLRLALNLRALPYDDCRLAEFVALDPRPRVIKCAYVSEAKLGDDVAEFVATLADEPFRGHELTLFEVGRHFPARANPVRGAPRDVEYAILTAPEDEIPMLLGRDADDLRPATSPIVAEALRDARGGAAFVRDRVFGGRLEALVRAGRVRGAVVSRPAVGEDDPNGLGEPHAHRARVLADQLCEVLDAGLDARERVTEIVRPRQRTEVLPRLVLLTHFHDVVAEKVGGAT